MAFNTLQYACFLPLVVLVCHLLPHRPRLWFLLVASYLFYASWNPWYLPLIVGLTVCNYALGLGLSGGSATRTRALLWAGIVLNLGTLGFYKYALFGLSVLAGTLGLVGFEIMPSPPPIALPLGISFFIFEFIHYLVDVSRGSAVVRSPVEFALFAAFFPTQVAGPIKRYEQFVPQLDLPPRLDWCAVGDGLRLIVVGLFKKSALADNLAPIVQLGFAQLAPEAGGVSRGDAWLVVIAFAMQIYLDFSGYTDIARGSARLLGYTVPENFRRPYLATNISAFWRRWHISLSSWLRDYLYIPLGGNRHHRNRNLFVTMVLGGLWHGANTTFIVWGALHGALLVGYWTMSGWSRTHLLALRLGRRWQIALLGWATTVALVCVGWVFFRAPNTAEALTMLGYMFGWLSGGARVLLGSQRILVVIVAVGCLALEGIAEWQEQRKTVPQRALPTMGWRTLVRTAGYVVLFALMLILTPSTGTRFIYFQF